MRIVFIGAVLFLEKALPKLIDMTAEVEGVCTLEKSPSKDLTGLSRLPQM